MIKANREVQQFLKFAVVGASGTLVDLGLLTLLVHATSLPTLAANTLSYSAGILNNFILNRIWTFSEARSKPLLTQFLQFTTISLIGLLLSDLIVAGTEPIFTGLLGKSAYLPAKLLAIGLVFLWNFFANRYWTYNDALVTASQG